MVFLLKQGNSGKFSKEPFSLQEPTVKSCVHLVHSGILQSLCELCHRCHERIHRGWHAMCLGVCKESRWVGWQYYTIFFTQMNVALELLFVHLLPKINLHIFKSLIGLVGDIAIAKIHLTGMFQRECTASGPFVVGPWYALAFVYWKQSMWECIQGTSMLRRSPFDGASTLF